MNPYPQTSNPKVKVAKKYSIRLLGETKVNVPQETLKAMNKPTSLRKTPISQNPTDVKSTKNQKKHSESGSSEKIYSEGSIK